MEETSEAATRVTCYVWNKQRTKRGKLWPVSTCQGSLYAGNMERTRLRGRVLAGSDGGRTLQKSEIRNAEFGNCF